MTTYVSRGLYSVPAAARLLRAKPGDLRRWAFGYGPADARHDPVIHTEITRLADEPVLTFVELVELMFVRAVRASRQSFPRIREAHRVLGRLLKTDHPFALRNVFEDPAGLYLRLEAEGEGELLVELRGDGQIAIPRALDRYLHELEFDVDDLATRWFPAGRATPIVVDPAVAFGAPVVAGTRIETALIAELHAGNESAESIAELYGLELAQVTAAIEYETALGA